MGWRVLSFFSPPPHSPALATAILLIFASKYDKSKFSLIDYITENYSTPLPLRSLVF